LPDSAAFSAARPEKAPIGSSFRQAANANNGRDSRGWRGARRDFSRQWLMNAANGQREYSPGKNQILAFEMTT